MKRLTLVLTALSLALLALAGADAQVSKKPKTLPYVVVDPNDLRKPVPEPEGSLTEKYDDKVVRFKGVIRRFTLDKAAKKFTYELHHDVVRVTAAKGKKVAIKEESIVVSVTFLHDEKGLRAKKSAAPLTVEGKGSVQSDGTLVISDAVIVPPVLAFPGGGPGPK